MFHLNRFRLGLAAVCVALVAGGTSHAASIGINFTSQTGVANSGINSSVGGTTFDVLGGFGPGVVAGAPGFAQNNWNHLVGDWSGNAANDTTLANLVDSNGNAVTNLGPVSGADRVHYDSANAFTSGIGNATANNTLMNGYLDDGGDNQPFAEFDVRYHGESGALGIGAYDVVLYFHGDGANAAVGRYWLEDFSGTVLTNQVGITNNDFTGTFISAGSFAQTGAPTNVSVSNGANFIVFTGITAPTIRVRGAGNGDPEDFGRGPINAIQLIAVTIPEPATATLGLLGLGGLMMRRRRMA